MKSINFNSGFKEYVVNGDESNIIQIFVADLNLGRRIDDMGAKLEELKKKYEGSENLDSKQFYSLDLEIREMIDSAFGADICSHAFGNVNCLSPVDSGKTLFESFLEAFVPLFKSEMESFISKNNKEPRPEVQKYLAENCANDDVPDISKLSAEQKKRLLEQLIS